VLQELLALHVMFWLENRAIKQSQMVACKRPDRKSVSIWFLRSKY